MARRTDEVDKDVLALRMELTSLRAKVSSLEARIAVLEREIAATRGAKPTSARKSIKPAAGPPPLPGLPVNMPALPRSTRSPSSSKRSYVDISDVAELVDSVPPPSTRGSKR